MLAKIPAGNPVPVTRWQIGTGALPVGAGLDRTELVTQFDYIPVSEITRKGNQATVLGQFTNQGRPAFAFEELGLYAADPDEGEILMCYGNAYGTGERIRRGQSSYGNSSLVLHSCFPAKPMLLPK